MPDATTQTGKKWIESKTLWVNFLAIIADIVANLTGHALPIGWDVVALSIINMVLRTLTRDPIAW